VVNAQLNAGTPGGSPSRMSTVCWQPSPPSQGSSAARLLPPLGRVFGEGAMTRSVARWCQDANHTTPPRGLERKKLRLAEKTVKDDVPKHPDQLEGGLPRPAAYLPATQPFPASEPLAPKPRHVSESRELWLVSAVRSCYAAKSRRSESVGGCPRYSWSRKARRGSLLRSQGDGPRIRRCVAMYGSPR
jgi:hypothetical protein